MSAHAPFSFLPAYRQLQATERAFVDAYVMHIEHTSFRQQIPMYTVLTDPETPHPMDADSRSRDMLGRPLVQAAIADRVREVSEDAEISEYKLLKTTWNIANSNITNYFSMDEHGATEFHIDKCTPEQQAAIKSIEIERNPKGANKTKIVLHDKIAAIVLMGKYTGTFDDGETFRKEAVAKKPKLLATATAEDAAAAYARLIGD